MATISSRFRVRSIESVSGRRMKPLADAARNAEYEEVRLRNIVLTPVVSSAVPNADNLRMWHGVPTGNITLSGIAPEVAKLFELDKVIKVNFTPVE